MIQIDMMMPNSCKSCPFCNDCDAICCVILPHVPAMQKDVENSTDQRSRYCPLKEVKKEEHEDFQIPERCGECQSMRTMFGPLGPWQYCGASSKMFEDPQADIQTVKVSLFDRPDWCPMVKTQKTLDGLPPEKREKIDMMIRGFRAIFEMNDKE